jgi:hypothetical protein
LKDFDELGFVLCDNIDVIIKVLHYSEVNFGLICRITFIFQAKLIITLNFGFIQSRNSVISKGLNQKVCQFDLLRLFGIDQRVYEGIYLVMGFVWGKFQHRVNNVI